MRRILYALAATLLITNLQAELPPSAYEQMQAESPEFLDVEILRVDIEPGAEADQQDVQLTARILTVHRTSSNLQQGGMLNIVYTLTARPPGFVGPGQVSIPAEGDKTVAYLKNGEKPDEFLPAAGAMTFRNF
ncbi:MAG: hypothetical protein WCG66_07505 [bacterium]